jgi:hypothetical protein
MNWSNQEDLDKILNEMDVDHIPAEFVKSARISYLEGESQIISPEELESIVSHHISLEDLGISTIGLILDLDIIKRTVREHSETILKDIPA